VHVWCARLHPAAAEAGAKLGLLAPDERARAGRFRSAVHRDRFILGRAAQRDILAAYTGVEPHAIEFRYSDRGKPSLAGEPGEGIRFNTSNAGDLAVVAVTAGAEVGIDVEEERVIPDALALARRFFSAAEVVALQAAPADRVPRAFLTCWTRKEAFVKAIGLGVTMPLADFDVTVAPEEPPALLATRPDPALAGRWSMRAVDVGAGYLCTVVVESPVQAVRVFDHVW
jgi:4'-phosphopantetheinyl transferase